jgi:hypothetical protein
LEKPFKNPEDPRMKDLTSRAVQLASQDEIFQSMSYAALRARAGRMEPGDIIRIAGREMVVAEDEEGTGIVVQIIESRKQVEEVAWSYARKAGLDLEPGREWMDAFLRELGEVINKWQDIKMRPGPGENLTFEKAVDRRKEAWR